MLSYLVGTERSVVFVVPPGGRGVEAVTLDIPAEVGSILGVKPGPLTAAILRTVLAGDSTAGPDGGLFYDLSTSSRGSTVVGRRPPRAPEARLHALWRVLLPRGVWDQVGDAAEVVIVPDGPLHFLPFEALVVDTVRTADGVTYWLDDGPPIRYAGSATALVNITRRPAARVVRAADGPMILSLSDPIFDPAALAGRPDTAEAAATRDGYLRGGGSLARLPGTAQETESVRNTLGAGAASRLEVLSGAQATEANLRTSLGGVRYLHLATNGLVDQQRGALFASLALTPPAGETSDHANDGFWQLHEIYDARLPELELAVLSACQSNIGRNVVGEGVFALSRGFTAAGARRVVATQWSVDDASTAVLVGEFFRRVLTEENQGVRVRYAMALRDAQRAVRSQARWRDPFYWAPFILTGKE
jgi:CHAT domain-containing protein